SQQSAHQRSPDAPVPWRIALCKPRPRRRGKIQREFRPPPGWGRCFPAEVVEEASAPTPGKMSREQIPPPPPERLPSSLPGSPRNRSRPAPDVYSSRTVPFRKCGNRPLPAHRHDWRSSYKPPIYIRGQRRWDRPTGRSPPRGPNRLAVFLGVVAILSLLWLPAGIVLAMFFRFRGEGFGGRVGPLQRAQLRFDLVHEADIFVVLHHPDLRAVIRMAHRRWPQVDLRHVLRLHAHCVQRQREREEDHPKRHHKPRLTHKGRHRSEE